MSGSGPKAPEAIHLHTFSAQAKAPRFLDMTCLEFCVKPLRGSVATVVCTSRLRSAAGPASNGTKHW